MSHYSCHNKAQSRYDNTQPQKSQWEHADYSRLESDHRSQGGGPLSLNEYLVHNYPTQWCHSAQHSRKQPWNSDRYAEGTYGQRSNFNTQHDYEQPQQTDFRSLSPSPSYVAVSLERSVPSETSPRKLLVLDLNGTLLLRSKRLPRTRGPFKPVMRTVHPRPYLTSFRRYLFHPDTVRWLDVMVWSSAQPHSVQDMLQHCFPPSEEMENTSSSDRFIAVWARDTLGLSNADYSRKVQTTKDLYRPWLQLSPSVDNTFRTKHSAHTTLLLDDSPLKACLQPWNHVCVPEYDAAAHAASTLALAGQAGNANSNPPCSAPTSSSFDSSQLDNILLAVIGILQALRSESNVAAWIRAGGLSFVRKGGGDPANDDHKKAVVEESVTPACTVYLSASDSLDATSPVLSALEPVPLSPPTYLSTTSVSNASSHRSSASLDAEPEKSWFEHVPTLAYWVAQGRSALRVLGITEVASDDS